MLLIRRKRITLPMSPGGFRAAAFIALAIVRTSAGQCELQKLFASDASPVGDQFGEAVAVSGDTAVIAARWDDHPGCFPAGSAYVFQLDPDLGAWIQVAELTASDDCPGGGFGLSVSISDDVILIGAPNKAPNKSTDAGAAYIFKKPLTGWADNTETQTLTAFDAAAGDLFGRSVSISGDVALIGALGDDAFAGAAYMFRYDSMMGEWNHDVKLIAPVDDRNPNDAYGHSVSISAGVSIGETVFDVAVIGAPGDDEAAGDAGAAYLWRFPGGPSKLMLPDAAEGDTFGESVYVSGNSAVIGGRWYFSVNSAYVYTFDAGPGVATPARLTASGPGSVFGWTVTINGDTVVVGGPTTGPAYVFQRPAGGWADMTETAILTPSGGLTSGFGQSVAVSGGLALIGARGDDEACDPGCDPWCPPACNAGAAYVFDLNACICPTDINGDGVTNVLDLIDLLLCFGQPANPPCDTGQDIIPDGTVNVLDLIELLLAFGQTCP